MLKKSGKQNITIKFKFSTEWLKRSDFVELPYVIKYLVLDNNIDQKKIF